MQAETVLKVRRGQPLYLIIYLYPGTQPWLIACLGLLSLNEVPLD